jgi:hypothetical protein
MSTRKQTVIDALPIAIAAHLWFDGAAADKLYRLAKRGELRLTKIGRRTYVMREDADRFHRSQPKLAPVMLP